MPSSFRIFRAPQVSLTATGVAERLSTYSRRITSEIVQRCSWDLVVRSKAPERLRHSCVPGRFASSFSDGADALIRRPTLIGAIVGKIAAVTELVSQSPAERARHMRDVDALARLVGPADRDGASLTSRERSSVEHLAVDPALSKLAATSLRLLAATKRKS